MAGTDKILNADIAIFGAGIAGLWLLSHLRGLGYNAILLENSAIGGGQSIASQGIIHSGLKFTLGGKVNALAKSLSLMPDVWRAALGGEGPVDLSAANIAAPSQQLLIPKGVIGGITKTISQKLLGDSVSEILPADWPIEITQAGFKGSLINMNELVLDIPSVIKALAEPHRDHILKIDNAEDALAHINAKLHIFTAAESNAEIAEATGHNQGLETQRRPLLMGIMKNVPFPLFAHLVGKSDKPVATITTHKAQDGALIWYIGAGVTERAKDSDPAQVYTAIKKALAKYLPHLDLSGIEWTTLPIDRVEGKSKTDGWMPNAPTIHEVDNTLYCWPTKLTFAPMLCDMVIEKIGAKNITPSHDAADTNNWENAEYATAPWDTADWTRL